MIYFISGHGLYNINKPNYLVDLAKLFQNTYIPIINYAIEQKSKFLIGDYEGIDDWANRYIASQNYFDVQICHIGEKPRYNYGKFKCIPNFTSDEERDSYMTLNSDTDIAFYLPGYKHSGTGRNIHRRKNKID